MRINSLGMYNTYNTYNKTQVYFKGTKADNVDKKQQENPEERCKKYLDNADKAIEKKEYEKALEFLYNLIHDDAVQELGKRHGIDRIVLYSVILEQEFVKIAKQTPAPFKENELLDSKNNLLAIERLNTAIKLLKVKTYIENLSDHPDYVLKQISDKD